MSRRAIGSRLSADIKRERAMSSPCVRAVRLVPIKSSSAFVPSSLMGRHTLLGRTSRAEDMAPESLDSSIRGTRSIKES